MLNLTLKNNTQHTRSSLCSWEENFTICSRKNNLNPVTLSQSKKFVSNRKQKNYHLHSDGNVASKCTVTGSQSWNCPCGQPTLLFTISKIKINYFFHYFLIVRLVIRHTSPVREESTAYAILHYITKNLLGLANSCVLKASDSTTRHWLGSWPMRR